ncbi:MAG TPA: R3H domain-containing nucleic acid-binding protein [Solirubrobacteraceae bacterium]|jgi:spoIIIJ-associated protein
MSELMDEGSERDLSTGDTPSQDGDPAETLHDLLCEIADGLGLDVEVDVEVADGVLNGRLEGDDVGPLIGRRGQTIDAIQHIAQRVVFKSSKDAGRVLVDAGGYRERRHEALCAEADDAAEEAIRLAGRVEFEPMTASERRVLHEHLRERGDVSTHSEGDEPERYLVVEPLED